MSAFAIIAIYAAFGALVCGLVLCVKPIRESPRIHWWNWLGLFIVWPAFVLLMVAHAIATLIEEFQKQ